MPALSTSANSAIPLGARRRDKALDSLEPGESRTLYVHRKLLNGAALRKWAIDAGFKTTLDPSDMHVTIAYSKAPVDWSLLSPDDEDAHLDTGGQRSVSLLGDDAVVLKFKMTELDKRWQQFKDAGASWDHDGYRPHVTISYEPGDVDIASIKPYDGPLEFGPEVFAEVKPGWSADVKMLAATDSALSMALDRESVREIGRDGRLFVKVANISKANVCPYRGKEIPAFQDLGLDPDRIYNLLRDPEELRKAAPSLNGVQLLRKHIPVKAEDHQPYDTVGSLGTDAEFDGTYLKNSLFVNAQDAIEGIESGKKRELSAGYHYKPDMTPGNFDGKAYDGVMRDIVFNHVALVEDGRAGPDVIVGDEALKEIDMSKPTRFAAMTLRRTAAALAPLLAMDQKVTLPTGLFKGLTTANYKDNRDKMLAGVRNAVDGKLRTGLALDASMKDFANAIDAFKEDMSGSPDDPGREEEDDLKKAAEVTAAPKPLTEPGSTYDAEPLKNFLREKGMGEDDIMKACDMMPNIPGATDEDPDDAEAKKKAEAEAKKKAEEKTAADKAAKDAEMKDTVSKPAMDAALKAQADSFEKRIATVRETERGVRSALMEVKPWVGELPASMAFDSAADVYRHALGMREVSDAKTLHADALFPILKSLPKIGATAPQNNNGEVALAMDSVSKAIKMAPGLANISTVL